MSRSGYSDDCDSAELALWRGAVDASIRGKRGQSLLREMRDAMDAMPSKRLIAGSLVEENGDRCALGCVAVARGMDVSKVNPHDSTAVANAFGVARALVKEIAFLNDDSDCYGYHTSTPEERWAYMRKWLDKNIKEPACGLAPSRAGGAE